VGAASPFLNWQALAQGQTDRVLIVSEMNANSLDTHTVGANRAAYGVVWMTYDRLITFGTKTLPNGVQSYDYFSLKPQLAESWEFAPDNSAVTFKLRRDATFHDGTPVKAQDAKWSFDRFVKVGGFPQRQMEQGSLSSVDQFEVVDDYTFRVKFLRSDKLTMPSLAIVVPSVYNSELCKKNATAADPWALEWTKNNCAASGAFKVESFKSSEQIILARFDGWKGGSPPKFQRAMFRNVAAAGTRRALVEKGDADVSPDLPPREIADISAGKKFKVEAASPRYLGHAIANQVIQSTTGSPGIFGTRLAVVGSKSGNKEIYTIGLDGHDVQAVTRNGAINLSPGWSPDGKSIAWTSYKKANPDLYVKDLVSGRTRTISNVKGVNPSPDFSPDGSQLALARSVEGDSDLFLVDARTGTLVRQLTQGGGIDVSPDFSADGKQIAFASERSGGSQVYLMPIGGGDAKRISITGDFNIDPVISPDQKKIAWVGRSEGGFDIYVADLDGRNVVRLTQDMADNEDPTWSPDSKYLVFSSTRNGGKSDLWISTIDGRSQFKLTNTGGWTQPAWTPGMP